MKSSIVPLIKSKTGDTIDKNNYRPIAIVTVLSKKNEFSILNIILRTSGNQFGFKKKHSTNMAIYVSKSAFSVSKFGKFGFRFQKIEFSVSNIFYAFGSSVSL